MSLVSHLHAAINVTSPVLILLLAGIVFKKIKLIDDHFVGVGNKLVFMVTLPCMLFLNVASSSLGESMNLPLIGFAVVATLSSVILLWFVSPIFVEKSKRGVFTQCAFRGNMAIVGLALCVNAFGDAVLPMAAVYLACLTVLYNVLAVLLLSNTRLGVVKNLVKNPLIIGILAGAAWSSLSIPVPTVMELSMKYLAKLTLPLALLCIGSSLEWKSFKANHKEAAIATVFKLVVLPGAIVWIGYMLGFRDAPLGILFLMMASPTAAAAYIMSRQMSAHGNMAAEIITVSTALSPITVTFGLALLGYYGLV